jgi:hypothetical protein
MIPSIQEQIGNLRGVEGKDKEYYDLLKKWYFNHGAMPYGWAYKQARAYAKTLPDFGVTEKDATLISERAKADKMARPKLQGVPFKEQNRVIQHDLDKQVMRLHFERLTQTR